MHEPYRSPGHEPGAGERAYPAGQHETRAFETRPFEGRQHEHRPFEGRHVDDQQFDDPPNHHLETQAFDTAHFEPAPHPQPRPHEQHGRPYEPQPRPHEQSARPYEPLAHEGGLPYGTPPAPPAYRPPQQQFIPQHLAMPQQFAPGPYGQGHGQFPQPYMYQPHQMNPMNPMNPMPQTIYVHNTRRVNHVLHLVLTLLTFGLWLPVWIILAIANS